jgi:hypothetical protein
MEFEGSSELAYQLSRLAVGIRGDVAGLIGFRYCDPVVGAPQHVLCVIQMCVWEPSMNLLNVSLVQNLRDNAYVCVEKVRKESGPWLLALKK